MVQNFRDKKIIFSLIIVTRSFNEKLTEGVELDIVREYFRELKVPLDINIKLVNITLINGPFVSSLNRNLRRTLFPL
jgi:hypothetical protein